MLLKYISESLILVGVVREEIFIKALAPLILVFNIKKLISFFLSGQILSGVFSVIFLANPILSS